jgi:hypothetical protein
VYAQLFALFVSHRQFAITVSCLLIHLTMQVSFKLFSKLLMWQFYVHLFSYFIMLVFMCVCVCVCVCMEVIVLCCQVYLIWYAEHLSRIVVIANENNCLCVYNFHCRLHFKCMLLEQTDSVAWPLTSFVVERC